MEYARFLTGSVGEHVSENGGTWSWHFPSLKALTWQILQQCEQRHLWMLKTLQGPVKSGSDFLLESLLVGAACFRRFYDWPSIVDSAWLLCFGSLF
jgi:hypothetical protein